MADATKLLPPRNRKKAMALKGETDNPMKQIAIIGLGYVGLPLALQFAKSSLTVIGLDIDSAKINSLNAGRTYIRGVPEAAIKEFVGARKFQPTTQFARIQDTQAVIICVPTPLTKAREPDLSFVLNTARAVAPHLRRGTLVVLESTTYPGTTENELRVVLERGSGMKAGDDFHLAFSPEREDPGNSKFDRSNIPQIVGGYSLACRDRAVALYSLVTEKVVPVSSCGAAEATKLLENTFRSVNIALVNELKMIYAAMGIDIWEAIAAATTKPFGFMPFYPGPGLGGHCIPIDPFYLAWKAREYGKNARFIELAGEINTSMPEYVADRLINALTSQQKSIKDSTVLLIGIAYKPNIDDTRESPTFVLLDKLKVLGAKVAYYDPFVPVIRPTRQYMRWAGTRSIVWREDIIRSFDAAVVVTAHRVIDYPQLADWSRCIVDTRNVFGGDAQEGGANQKIWKA